MTEVEKHYATDRTSADARPGGPTSRGTGPADHSSDASLASRAAHAVEGARESLKDASAWSQERYEDAASWASEAAESVSRNVTYARRRSMAELSRSRRRVENLVEENPIMVGVVGLAAGLLIGALLPTTRREKEYLGPYAEEIREQGRRYAQEVVEQGRHIVEENLSRLAPTRVDRDTGDETTATR